MADMSQAEEAFTQATEGASAPKVNDEQAVYELAFHIVPQIPEDGVGAVVEKLHKLIGKAEVVTEQVPAKMTLSYTIERADSGKREKFDTAYFGWIKFVTERSEIQGIEQGVRAMSEVLRYLLVETVRENTMEQPRRAAVFTSDRLEGQTIEKPVAPVEKSAEVSEEELNKSLEGLIS
ncbi:MAG: 30S ribosomal protein S6 [Patescibacteria group bacterium]